MANAMLKILAVPSPFSRVLMSRHSKYAFLQVTLNFELEYMIISSIQQKVWKSYEGQKLPISTGKFNQMIQYQWKMTLSAEVVSKLVYCPLFVSN